MTANRTARFPRLRRALLVDAAASGAMGVLLVLAAAPLASLFGLPESLLRWTGVVLVPFAGALAWIATHVASPHGPVRTIVSANVGWVIASVLLLISGLVAPTQLGVAFVLVQAVVVAAFAGVEYYGLRRLTGEGY